MLGRRNDIETICNELDVGILLSNTIGSSNVAF